jgi:actin-related protein 2
MSLRKELYGNILISGGTSMMPGFPTRLLKDIKDLFSQRVRKGAEGPSGIKIRVIDPPTRKYNVFIGASILAATSANAEKYWISKQEYQQKGKTRLAQELTPY